MWIDRDGDDFIVHQKDYVSKIEEMQHSPTLSTKALYQNFRRIRGKLAYLESCTRLDLCYNVAYLSQFTEININESDVAFLISCVRKAQRGSSMKSLKLDLASLHCAGYADAGFANNKDLSSQLGFLVVLKDKFDKCAIIHYGS